jgi:hypothetical protein
MKKRLSYIPFEKSLRGGVNHEACMGLDVRCDERGITDNMVIIKTFCIVMPWADG